jgi:hypothetical protein
MNILSRFSYSDFVEFTSDDKHYQISQILVLRQVCHLFRILSTSLLLWTERDITFGSLIRGPGCDHPNQVRVQLEKEAGFLKALFEDEFLVNTVSCKRIHWTFDSLAELRIIIQYIPGFKDNVRSIELELWHGEGKGYLDNLTDLQDVNDAFAALSACSCVTTLSITMASEINLDLITALFPSLETLVLSDVCTCSGSLQGLGHLDQLTFLAIHDVDISETMRLLPLSSAQTITHLDLEFRGEVNNPWFNFEPLCSFVHLTSLMIGPLCPGICGFIIMSQFRLTVFEAVVTRDLLPIEIFALMFKAQSLEHLKRLELINSNDKHSDTRVIERFWFSAFDAFTSNLLSVEEVELNGVPLQLRCCQLFSRMVNLQSLNWDAYKLPHFGCGNGRPESAMRGALEKAFANFEEKPILGVFYDFKEESSEDENTSM